MFEISVYYDDVFRYTIVGNWDKVQELRNIGLAVKVKEASDQGSGLGEWRSFRSFKVNEVGDVIASHDDEYSARQQAETGSDVEHDAFGYY